MRSVFDTTLLDILLSSRLSAADEQPAMELPADGNPRTVYLSVERILAAISRDNSTFQFHFRAVPEVLKKRAAEGRLTKEDKDLLVA